MEIPLLAPDGGQVGGERGFDPDVLTDDPVEEPDGVSHHLVQIDRRNGDFALAAEREQLTGQARGPFAGLADVLGQRGQPAAIARGLFGEQFGTAVDDGEEIVEVVGNPASELAQRFKLGFLPEMALAAAPSPRTAA